MELPQPFLNKMKFLLKDEYEPFIESYAEQKQQGLRLNTLKVTMDEWEKINPFQLKPIPWVKGGFFYTAADRPGKHPYHEAGLYYLQEPSAMAVAEIAKAKKGEKVLDLCAAPGGKTTHLASQMEQEGLLVANEIHPARAKILSQNVERLGIKNVVVTNETPAKLAKRFVHFFDRIIVDAPCSGEGMFRKDAEACEQWSMDNVLQCATRQIDILIEAAKMLRGGGTLVYSTCTFSPEENEAVIQRFLEEDARFELIEVDDEQQFSRGRRDWIENGSPEIERTLRLWPHKIQGEGHFIAVLKKTSTEQAKKQKDTFKSLSEKQLEHFHSFRRMTLTDQIDGRYMLFGEQLYVVPDDMPSFEKLKVLRPGWHLGTMKKNRFEPSHSLALSLRASDVVQTCNFSSDSKEIAAYLRGEALSIGGEDGWCLVTVDQFSIGWGKRTNGTLKNHYPKGLRRHE